jgi:hypothetical protein
MAQVLFAVLDGIPAWNARLAIPEHRVSFSGHTVSRAGGKNNSHQAFIFSGETLRIVNTTITVGARAMSARTEARIGILSCTDAESV